MCLIWLLECNKEKRLKKENFLGYFYKKIKLWTPHFWLLCVSTKKARLVFLFKTKKPFLENGLESPLIFVFILKGKTK